MLLYQKSLTIPTTDEVVGVHAEQAVSCQPLGVGTADVEGLQAAVAEPLRQPLQLAVTQQAAGVQNAADTRQKNQSFPFHVPMRDFMQQLEVCMFRNGQDLQHSFMPIGIYYKMLAIYAIYKPRKTFPLCQH